MDAIVARPNDLESFWMPYTANRDFKARPRMCVSARGMYYRSADGRPILDGTAGLWCVNAGHCAPRIVEAVQRQVAELDFAPTFQFGHPKAFELAGRLAQLFPPSLSHAFFANSGSEAVDTALKIALAYHRARGEGQRTRLIGRERGYHGSGFGGMAVGGIAKNRAMFGAMVQPVDHLRHTHLAANAFSRGAPDHGAELADDLERLVALHDASTIAAVIVEPLAGSTGVLVPPKGYLARLRETCDRHGILLIFDEVITGFGRLGTTSAADYFGVVPDLMVLAKAITNAVVPMGAVMSSGAIYEAVVDASPTPIELFHGYTYSGHPLACAAALATLDVYRDDALFSRAASLAPLWEDAVHRLADRRHVVDVRNLGLVGAIELAPREGAPGARGMDAVQLAFDAGLMIRVTGDIIALSPPLVITEDEIETIVLTLATVLDAVE
ncbi:aspartate aminotransferase family protein [Acuticoccus sp.]|uniref:aspartate aminotransferase family protein n=1 Tax=Acuticoccus sp. TaxID=1904378 RepID=UPI003B52E192